MTSPTISLASRLNPIAAPVYRGLVTPVGPVYYDYPEDIVLTGGATNVQDVIKTDTDAPFHLCAIIANVYTSIQVSLQINVNGVYYMSEFPILLGNLASDPAAPPPVLGKFIIPAGANINFVFNELSGAGNTLQLILRGMKLYGYGQTPAGQAQQPFQSL